MTTSNCMTCIYGGSWCGDHTETGYCYMFKEEPEGVCAKWAMSIRDSQAAPSTSQLTDWDIAADMEVADAKWADADVPLGWAKHFARAIELKIKGDA